MKRFTALASTAVLAFGASACGSSDDDGDSPAGGNGGATTAGEVKMTDDLKFEPESITVKAGDKVTWKNTGNVPHNAIAEGGEFKSETFGKDGTFAFTTKAAGEIKYSCTLHPGMDGTITVE